MWLLVVEILLLFLPWLPLSPLGKAVISLLLGLCCFSWTTAGRIDREQFTCLISTSLPAAFSHLDESPLALVGQGSTSILHKIPTLCSDVEATAVYGRAPCKVLASEGDRHSFKSLDCTRILEKIIQNKGSQCFPHKMDRNARPSWRTVSSSKWHGCRSLSTVLVVWSRSLRPVLLSIWSCLFYVFSDLPEFWLTDVIL